MAVALTGKLHSGVNKIIKLLVNSTNFRDWVCAGDPLTAEEFIWSYEKDPDLKQKKYIIVSEGEFAGQTGGNVNRGCIGFKLITGSKFTFFEENERMNSDTAVSFVNMVGEVINDLLNLQNSSLEFQPIDTIAKIDEINLRFRDGDDGRQGYQMGFEESYQQL